VYVDGRIPDCLLVVYPVRTRPYPTALPVNGAHAHVLPTPAQLDAAVARAAAEGCAVKALLLTNPSNPLGVVYTPAELTVAVTWALHKGMHVVVDEVYASSVFADGGSPFVSALAMVGLSRHSPGVSDWLRGPCWLASIRVLTIHALLVDHTGYHQLVF
jgi:hypothetical protein